MNNQEIKRRTQELYDQLPQLKIVRSMQFVQWDDNEHKWKFEFMPQKYPEILKIRDEIISINSAFFGYIVTSTFLNNKFSEYTDRYNSAIKSFCECWWWYKWKGDYSHKPYRSDITFSVFFKPRIGEMLEREFNEVKYSTRRALCQEVGDMLVPKKHWGKVTIDDLSDPHVKLPADKMNSLKAIFGTLIDTDIADHENYLYSESKYYSEFDDELDTNYDSWEELLIRIMVKEGRQLTDSDLIDIQDTYQVGELELERRGDYNHSDPEVVGLYALKQALPGAMKMLKSRLEHSLMLKQTVE